MTTYDVFRFGPFELGRTRGALRKHGIRIRLQEQPVQVLIALLERQGEIVTREELRSRVWPEQSIADTDHSLNTAIKKIRTALSDDPDEPRYVETVPRRGYRFIAELGDATVPILVSPVALASKDGQPTPPSASLHFLRFAPLLLLLASGIVFFWMYWKTRQKLIQEVPLPHVTIVVLPFQDANASPPLDPLSAKMTERTMEVLGQINPSRIGVLQQISQQNAKAAGRGSTGLVRADYLLAGKLDRQGNHLRVAAELVAPGTNIPRWTLSLDRDLTGTGFPEDEVACTIAKEINRQLTLVLADPSPRGWR